MVTVGANGNSGAASDGETQNLEVQCLKKFNLTMQKKLAAIATRLVL